ncbi:MAG: hypothetical protein CVU36_08890 [Betaproteobacteria bacterium HGW-Betaproteobacteria-9]|jgi:hypothetical protein|nr:MAG: hypothetical protein CVU36_08890 [Betaproteobacteria bacterium HGW-Betaproteobacteria-9]
MPGMRASPASTATLCLLALVSGGAQAGGSLWQRDLKCTSEKSERAQVICRALEKEMQLAGTGHAMPGLPSFQVTFKTAARVFCRLPVRAEDTPTLVEMALWHRYAATDSSLRAAQLSRGTTLLLALLGDAAHARYPTMETLHKPQAWMTDREIEVLRREITDMTDHPASLFSPRFPDYLLQGGCQSVP